MTFAGIRPSLVCVGSINDYTRGAEGRGEQRRGSRTKALMRDLGTRLECRHKSFCKNWKNIVEINP